MNEASEKIYHIVISSERGLLCRDDQDYTRFENYIAFSVLRDSCTLLAHSVMSTHVHIAIVGTSLKSFIERLKKSYTTYYNAKYSTKGPVCTRNTYFREVSGWHAIKALISYILRNPLHHGITETPFQYAHSSIRAYFRKELRLWTSEKEDSASIAQYICMRTDGSTSRLPADENGRVLLNQFVNYGRVEYLYRSARSFLHSMIRWNTEDWNREQQKENPAAEPIDLRTSEPMPGMTVEQMRSYEKGVFRLPVRDSEICRHLDKEILLQMGIRSFAWLNPAQRRELSTYLQRHFHISQEQASRCLEA